MSVFEEQIEIPTPEQLRKISNGELYELLNRTSERMRDFAFYVASFLYDDLSAVGPGAKENLAEFREAGNRKKLVLDECDRRWRATRAARAAEQEAA